MAGSDRILIIDDDPEICKLLSVSLSPLGCEVTSANDGFQALERIETEQFNVVILDLMLPGPDGIEILKHIRERRIGTEVVMLTAHASLETAIEALRLGAYDYVTKPFQVDTLRSTVRRAVEKQHLETRLDAIHDLSRRVALSLSVDQVAEAVLDIVERVLEFEICGLGLVGVDADVDVDVDREQDELYWLAARGVGRKVAPRAPLSSEKGITVAVARSGEPLYVPDVWEDPRYVEVRAATRSELAVPLKVQDRVIGVLNVESTKLDAFSQGDARLLSTLAAQAAVAIENARLYEQAQEEIAERKRAEEEITRRRDHYRAVVNGLHDQVLIIDRDYRITDVNAIFLRQMGCTREEIIGRHCYEVVHHRDERCDGTDHPCPTRQVWQTSQPARATHVCYDSEGGTRWLDAAASPLCDAKGQVTQVITAYRDVTAERRLEERLAGVHALGQELVLSREKRQVAQVTVDAALFLLQSQLCGLWLVDREERRLAPQAYAGGTQSVNLYTLPLDDKGGIIAAVARSGEPIHVPDVQKEPRYVGASPESRSALCVPLKVKERLVGVLNTESDGPNAFDEADQRLFAALADYSALALENAHLYEQTARRLAETRVLQEVILAAASTLDFDQVLTRAIRAIHRTLNVEYISFGLPDESGEYLVLHPSLIGFPRPPEGNLRIPLDNRSTPGQVYVTGQPQLIGDVLQVPYHSEHTPGLRSGLVVPVQVGNQVIAVLNIGSPRLSAFDENDLHLFGAIAAQLGVVIENARLYEAEREQRKLVEQSRTQLVQSEKLAATGRLAASLAHEINNPLQAIHNSLQLILSFPLEPDEQREYLQVAGEEVERLIGIVTRILDFARRPQQDTRPTNLNAVVEKTLALAIKYFQHRHIVLQRDLSSDLPCVLATPGELEQVFLNLVVNAVEAMPEGGTLRVSNRRAEDGHVTVTFSDTGHGIPAEHLDRIFEPFFSTKEEGTGLGLSVSYNVIKRHRGKITVQSVVGEGTTFTVWLPMMPA